MLKQMMPDNGENAIKRILLFYLNKYVLLSLNMTMVRPVRRDVS